MAAAESFADLPVELRERVLQLVAPPDPEAWAKQPIPTLGGRSFLAAYNAPGGHGTVEAYLNGVDQFESGLGADPESEAQAAGGGRGLRPYPPAAGRGLFLFLLACLLGLVVVGGYLSLNELVVIPGRYDQLAARGVPVTGHVLECHYAHGEVCFIGYSYAGRDLTTTYGRDAYQFGAPGSEVALLVDPSDPSIVYTVRDVHTRYLDGGLLGLGVALAVTGLAGLAAVLVAYRRGAIRF